MALGASGFFFFFEVELHPFSKEALAFCPQLVKLDLVSPVEGFRVFRLLGFRSSST